MVLSWFAFLMRWHFCNMHEEQYSTDYEKRQVKKRLSHSGLDEIFFTEKAKFSQNRTS